MANKIWILTRESDNQEMISVDDAGLLSVFGSLTSNFSNGVGTNATFRRKLTNVTSAQLKALRATSVELVAAPGTGLIITPVNVVYRYNFLTTTYTLNAGTLRTFYGPVANNIPMHADVAGGLIDAAANRNIPFVPMIKQGPVTDATSLNMPIQLGNDGAAEYTLGLGSLDVLVIYGIHTP